MDNADRAGEYQEAFDARALEAQAQRARACGAVGGEWGPEQCTDCGETMLNERRAHGFVRCVDCQQDKEIIEARYAR